MSQVQAIQSKSLPATNNAAGSGVTRPVGQGAGSSAGQSRWVNFAANAQGTHLDLYLYGVIGGYDWNKDEFQDAAQVIDYLSSHANLETITVHINSLGGYVDEGLAILNYLRKHPASVTTEVDAFALSIASVIMLAGDTGKVRMARNAHVMVHNVSTGAWGNAKQLRKEAEVAERLEQSIIGEYVAKTGKADEDWQAMLDEETWLNAEEALELGLIDEITGPTDLDAAADAISVNIWKNIHDAELKHMPKDVQAQMTRRLSPSAARHAQPSANGAANPQGSQTPVNQGQQGGDQPPATPPATPAATNVGAGSGGAPAQPPAQNQQSASPAFDAEAERARMQQEMREAENKRRNEVKAVFANFGGVNGQYAEVATAALEDMDCDAAKARENLLNKIGEDSAKGTGGSVAGDYNNGRVTGDERDTRIDQAVNAMLARGGRATLNQGNPYGHMTLMDMAKANLNAAGVNHAGMTPMQIAGQAFNMHQTTSDFPVILERTISEAVLIEYGRVPTTYQEICAIGSVSDFREHRRVSIGAIGTLDDRTEGGEFKNKSVPDGERESIKASTKGNIIAITREAIINDDLGYFMNEARMIGNAAGLTIEQAVYQLLLSNPKMADGKTLFHADHGNKQTGAAMGEDSLDKMSVAMGTQKGVGGAGELAIAPAFLVVPRVMQMQAKKWMKSEFVPGSRDEPNGVQGMAEVVAPGQVKSGYYLFADPAMAPVLEVVFLNGIQEPYIETKDGWRVDGAEIKVRLDFGVGATGYRGAQFNPGASS